MTFPYRKHRQQSYNDYLLEANADRWMREQLERDELARSLRAKPAKPAKPAKASG